MLVLFLFAFVLVPACAFCDDGVSVPSVDGSQGDVQVTWVQAPLFSTNPQINQTGKYLNLFHTALVFRQDKTYWTLEFDATAEDLTGAIIPEIDDNGELIWNTDARWCLRDGIYNGYDHWTTAYDEVAAISPAQFLQIFYEFVPQYNASVPGAWPQYQFWRVEQAVGGEVMVDDTTCGHVFRVLEYIRDVFQVPLKERDYEITRVALPSLGATEVDMTDPSARADVVNFFTTLSNAVGGSTGVDAMMAIFQFFLPWKYVFDPVTGKYFKVSFGAPGEVILIWFVKFEPVGDLPLPPGVECDVTPSCASAMAVHADFGSGDACKSILGDKSDYLVANGCHANATQRAQDVNCYCGRNCFVESACLEKMSEHCTRGGGQSCVGCLVIAFPSIALFGPCDSGWGPSHIIDTSKARSCFCDDSQWTPDAASQPLLA